MFSFLIDLPSFNYTITDLIIFAVLIIIGILVLVFVIKLIFMFLPAIIVAAIVWWLTGYSLFWAGVAFLIIAVLSIIRKLV